MTTIRDRLILVSLVTILMAAEGPAPIKYNGFQVTTSENENKLQYTNLGYELTETVQNGITYLKPEMDGTGSNAEPGQPYLPTVSTLYAVEPGKSFRVQVTIHETETIENVDILPLESWDPVLTGNAEKGDAYFENALFPETIASVSEPIIMRELVMVQVSVTPFQYNPVTKDLTIIHSAEVELVEDGTAELPFIPVKRSRAFEALYESLVVNYATLSRDDIEYQRPAILYVLPNNIGNLLNTIEELMDWKKRVGYDVHYVSSSNVVNNKNNLKDYIEEAYENWDNPPVHVNIVGDATGNYDIPTWNESYSGYNGEGDHPYTTLEGGDPYPEVFIGRLSFSTSSHLNTIVSKTLSYE